MSVVGRGGPDRRGTAYLVGSGVAALASAAYLIRDGGFDGRNIRIFEESPRIGGSLDGAGSAAAGYVTRGARMFTYDAYACTFDLLSFIPSLSEPDLSVRDEFHRFNAACVYRPTCRLVAGGEKLPHTDLGISAGDRVRLVETIALPEVLLGAKRIDEVFAAGFFRSPFWLRLATSFGFQPWHSAVELKRYLQRFLQEFPRIHSHPAIQRAPLNDHDAIVRPLVQWLEAQGVRFETGTRVLDIDIEPGPKGRPVTAIHRERDGARDRIGISDRDLVFVTNGSMTAAARCGSMTAPAPLERDSRDGAWGLWETLAARQPDFGRPDTFTRDIDQSKWLSFTVTLGDPAFFQLMQAFTGDKAGEGGLITFVDSSWLMTILLPHQPHFIGQPDGVRVFWGYGLRVDRAGDFIKTPMAQCTGEEILAELVSHLRFDAHKAAILASANCIPCMMPYITSQFMPRSRGDRPPVLPPGTTNLAFIGQYCEIPDDTVFTVEYSVRSAQTAVYGLLGLDKPLPPIRKAKFEPGVLLAAARTLVR